MSTVAHILHVECIFLVSYEVKFMESRRKTTCFSMESNTRTHIATSHHIAEKASAGQSERARARLENMPNGRLCSAFVSALSSHIALVWNQRTEHSHALLTNGKHRPHGVSANPFRAGQVIVAVPIHTLALRHRSTDRKPNQTKPNK